MSYTAFFLKYSGFFSAFCVFLQLPLYPLTSRHKGSIRINRYQCPKQKHVQQIFSKIRNFRWICDAALYRSAPAYHTAVSTAKLELVGAGPLHLAYARPFCRLKAPLGLSLLHFAAQTRTCRGEAPPSCCARPFGRLKAPLGLSLLRKREQRSFCSAQNPASFGVKLAYGVVSAGNSSKEKA